MKWPHRPRDAVIWQYSVKLEPPFSNLSQVLSAIKPVPLNPNVHAELLLAEARYDEVKRKSI